MRRVQVADRNDSAGSELCLGQGRQRHAEIAIREYGHAEDKDDSDGTEDCRRRRRRWLFRCLFSKNPLQRQLDLFDKWSTANLGRVLIAKFPGWRPGLRTPSKYYCRPERILAVNNGFKCMLSAVTNAIYAHGDEKIA